MASQMVTVWIGKMLKRGSQSFHLIHTQTLTVNGMRMNENNIYSNECSDSEEIIEFDPSKFVSIGQYRMVNYRATEYGSACRE